MLLGYSPLAYRQGERGDVKTEVLQPDRMNPVAVGVAHSGGVATSVSREYSQMSSEVYSCHILRR